MKKVIIYGANGSLVLCVIEALKEQGDDKPIRCQQQHIQAVVNRCF